jgi:hypothetical protein
MSIGASRVAPPLSFAEIEPGEMDADKPDGIRRRGDGVGCSFSSPSSERAAAWPLM